MNTDHDTIVAPATAAGGAIAVIRISGGEAFAVCDRIFRGRRPLAEADGYTVHYGTIAEGDRVIDDVLAAVFRAPHSYTGENSVEISCHGSSYIVSEILRLLTAAGGRMAQPGEFTIRAYLAGKLDLSQAEAVADMIASSSRAAHALASTQMRGGYSEELESLREKLLNLTSLLELELDFSEEDVEFADRTALRATMQRIAAEIDRLRSSFSLGNAIKEGVAVAIAGAPNVGKSTLLNTLGCLDTPTSGEYYLDGIAVRSMDKNARATLRNRKIGFVFQNYNLLPKTTALENVELPLMYNSTYSAAQRRERAEQALRNVGLGDRMLHKSNQMSGGQMQRVAIARALVNDPAVILADEATGNLDTRTSFEVLVLFQQLHAQGRTIIFVTHNPEIARYSSRNVTLRDGHIISDVRNEQILSAAEALAKLPATDD